MPASFIQIPIALIDYVKLRKLSGIQYTLWLYLYTLDPFGDRYVPIPSPNQIATKLGVSARTIQRAAQRLADLDLFDFNIGSWAAKNTTTNKKSAKNSNRKKGSFCRQSDKNVESRTKMSQPRQNDPNAEHKSTQSKHPSSSQTNTDQENTLSEIAREEILDNNLALDLTVDYWSLDSTDTSIPVEIEILNEGSTSADVELNINKNNKQNEIVTAEIVSVSNHSDVIAATSSAPELPTKNSSKNAFSWLSPGPWNIEGKLDPNFRDWLAKDWMQRYGGTIHQKRADVLAHFRKDPANLAIRWEQYSSEYLDRYKNTQIRLENGLDLKVDEQKRLIENQAALTRELPQEMSPVAFKKALQVDRSAVTPVKKISPTSELRDSLEYDRNIKKVTNNTNNNNQKTNLSSTQKETGISNDNGSTIDWQKLPDDEVKPDNVEAYLEWQPSEIENTASSEQVQELFKSFRKSFGSMPKVSQEQVEAANELEKLNTWLLDEILYPVALQRAKSAGYKIEYSCEGVAISISEPEF